MQNLSHKEQILLERLSVFAGRFLREAAAAVCAGEGIEQNELGNLLAQQALGEDKSAAVWAVGRAIPFEQAVAYALEDS